MNTSNVTKNVDFDLGSNLCIFEASSYRTFGRVWVYWGILYVNLT